MVKINTSKLNIREKFYTRILCFEQNILLKAKIEGSHYLNDQDLGSGADRDWLSVKNWLSM